MKHTFLFIALLLMLSVSTFAQSVTPAPSLMNFQGRLAKPDGTPLADGTYSVTFSLWNVATGGSVMTNQLWSEADTVSVRNGSFAVLLGNTVAFGSSVFNGNVWLQIQVGTNAALTPRQQIVSVAFALKANTVPDGSISAAKIASDFKTAGGDLTGTYPNPTVNSNAISATKLALDFTSLARVSGNTLLSDGTNLRATGLLAINGTSTEPTWDTNMYLWSQTGFGARYDGYQHRFDVGNTRAEAMRITSNGRIGIGTKTPDQLLTVAGNAHITGNIGILGYLAAGLDDTFTYDNKTMANYGLGWFPDSWSSNPTAWLTGFGGIKLFTGFQPRLNITYGGNVGIGTTTPDQVLTVAGNAHVFNDVLIGGGISVGSNVNSNTITTNGITDNGNATFGGNVGIGVTNPLRPLHVSGRDWLFSNPQGPVNARGWFHSIDETGNYYMEPADDAGGANSVALALTRDGTLTLGSAGATATNVPNSVALGSTGGWLRLTSDYSPPFIDFYNKHNGNPNARIALYDSNTLTVQVPTTQFEGDVRVTGNLTVNGSDSFPPSGNAGGDLAGTYPNPSLATLASSLSKVSGGVMTSLNNNIGIGTSTPGTPLDVQTSGLFTLSLGSTSVNGTWLALRNKSAGGIPWNLISTGANNGEGAGNLVFENGSVGGDPLTILGSGGLRFPDGSTLATSKASGDLTGTFPNLTIANNAVTTNKVADRSLTSTKYALQSVDTYAIGPQAVNRDNLTDGAVWTVKLADGAVTNAKLANGSVDSFKLAVNAVDTANIKDGIVNSSKLAADASSLSKVTGGAASVSNSSLILNNGGRTITIGNIPNVSPYNGNAYGISVQSPSGPANNAGIYVNGGGISYVAANNVIPMSDARLKTNIQPICDPLDIVLALQGHTFNWKADTAPVPSQQIGFIAQEIEKILPDVVTITPGGYKGVSYNSVVPVLVEAMKAQQKQINDLKKQNATLADFKAENDKLKARVDACDATMKELLAAMKQLQKDQNAARPAAK